MLHTTIRRDKPATKTPAWLRRWPQPRQGKGPSRKQFPGGRTPSRRSSPSAFALSLRDRTHDNSTAKPRTKEKEREVERGRPRVKNRVRRILKTRNVVTRRGTNTEENEAPTEGRKEGRQPRTDGRTEGIEVTRYRRTEGRKEGNGDSLRAP